MLIDFLIVTAVTTTTALIWRALLLDHEKLLNFVKKIPLIGGALTCGFCFTVWLCLIVVLIYTPLVFWNYVDNSVIGIFVAWFTLSAAVLFLRNLIAVLMEGNGVLTHKHRSIDKEEENKK